MKHNRHHTKRRPIRWLLIPLAGFIMALSSCSDDDYKSRGPAVAVTDTKPVGEGLKVLGYALLGGCVVITLGRVIN